jgi:hypothetical protein
LFIIYIQQKIELSQTKGLLEEANQTIASLHTRIDQLANRPTHYLDLVADFESNFDRALQAIHPQFHPQQPQQQHTRVLEEDTITATTHYNYNSNNNGKIKKQFLSRRPEEREEEVSEEDYDFIKTQRQSLQAELEESKAQCQKLDSLNSTLLQRANRLEKVQEEMANQKEEMERNLALLTAELRSARAELDHTLLQQREYVAKSAEMQMEIEFLTKASVQSNQQLGRVLEQQQRIHSTAATTSNHHQRQQQQDLEAKVTALTEWALASAEAKQLAVEHVKHLEHKVHVLLDQLEQHQRRQALEDAGLDSSTINDTSITSATGSGGREDSTPLLVTQSKERKLWSEHSSLVIGAGMERSYVLEFRTDSTVLEGEIIVVRWKFDVTPSDMDIYFSMYKGNYTEKKGWESSDPLIKNRRVLGGGGGDIEGAFVIQNACTLVWSNTHSWIRPRTIKFLLDVFAITG